MDAISVIFVLAKEFEDESQSSEIMLQAFEVYKSVILKHLLLM